MYLFYYGFAVIYAYREIIPTETMSPGVVRFVLGSAIGLQE